MVQKDYESELEKYKSIPGMYSNPIETFHAPKKSWVEQRKWDIPDAFVIKVAPVGAFIMKEDNPNQKLTAEGIRNEMMESVEAGACAIHTHARDAQGKHSLDLKLYHEIIDPIKAKYGDKVLVCGCPEGGATLADNLRPILEFQGIMETAPITVTTVNLAGDFLFVSTPEIVQTSARVMQETGCKPEFVLHNLGDISLVKRWLIDTKIAKEPYYFRIAHGNPGWGYIEDPYTMFETISFLARELRKIAPGCAIMQDIAGRASLWLVPLAVELGFIGVRVGMEDAIYMYPHKDEMIKDNASMIRRTVAIVEALGRRVGTADDYRRFIREGVKNKL